MFPFAAQSSALPHGVARLPQPKFTWHHFLVYLNAKLGLEDIKNCAHMESPPAMAASRPRPKAALNSGYEGSHKSANGQHFETVVGFMMTTSKLKRSDCRQIHYSARQPKSS